MEINALVVIGALFGLFIYLLYAIYAYSKADNRANKRKAVFLSTLNGSDQENSFASPDLQQPSFSNGDLRYDYHYGSPN